jgi:NADPH2:quinone reductase
LFDAVISGRVKIHIEQTFPLAQIQEAHKALEARKTTGCTIITL